MLETQCIADESKIQDTGSSLPQSSVDIWIYSPHLGFRHHLYFVV